MNKSKDTLLLEQSYELILAKQMLLSEGYSKEEIDTLIAEGKFMDTVRSVGKSLGRGAAIAGTTAAGLFGGSAHGSEADDILRNIKQNTGAIVQSEIDNSTLSAKESQRISDQYVIDTAETAFRGLGLSKDGFQGLKNVLARLPLPIKSKRDVDTFNIRQEKFKQVINKTAEILRREGKDAKDSYTVYSAATTALNQLPK